MWIPDPGALFGLLDGMITAPQGQCHTARSRTGLPCGCQATASPPLPRSIPAQTRVRESTMLTCMSTVSTMHDLSCACMLGSLPRHDSMMLGNKISDSKLTVPTQAGFQSGSSMLPALLQRAWPPHMGPGEPLTQSSPATSYRRLN